jgi:hypothetical protein
VSQTSFSVEGEDILAERRVVRGKIHLDEALVSVTMRNRGAGCKNGSSLTTIEPAIIVDHEHDLPLKYVPVRHSTADARYVFVSLHLFELTSKQASSGRSGHGGLFEVGDRGPCHARLGRKIWLSIVGR